MPAKKGFTLIEMIVVMTIMVTLAAIAIPNYFSSVQQASVQNALNNLQGIVQGEKNYYFNNGFYCSYQDYSQPPTGAANNPSCGNSLTNLDSYLSLNIPPDPNFTYTCETINGTNFSCYAQNNNSVGYPGVVYDSVGNTQVSGSPLFVCVAGNTHNRTQYSSACPANLPIW